jgi:sugar/nucleoside kinase (ribokinase family)
MQGLAKLDNSHTLVVGKLCGEGCLTCYRGEWLRMPEFPIDVADTTGAGDSFNAGFLHTWLRSDAMKDCLLLLRHATPFSTRALGDCYSGDRSEAKAYFQAQAGISCDSA